MQSNDDFGRTVDMNKKIATGFLISFWGIDIMFGSVLMMIAVGMYIGFKCYDDPIKVTIGALGVGGICLVGAILLMAGKWGFLDRQVKQIEKNGGNELEQWFRMQMLGLRGANRENLVNAVAVITELPPAQIASISGSTGIISGFYATGKVFTGNNFLKMHWPLLIICIMSVGLFIAAFI